MTRHSRGCALRRAFTLVEVLAATAVIAILAALVVASYRRVIDQARQAECLVNLRSLSQGILLYAEDQGAFPPTSHSGGSWAPEVASYLEQPVLSSGSDYRTRKPFLCPANAIKSPDNLPTVSYAMNVFFELTSAQRYTSGGMPVMSRDSYAGSPATWHRPVAVPFPARTVLLAENANPAATADHFMAHQWSTLATAANAIDGARHGGRSNFAFVDGHVASLAVADTFDPSRQIDRWNPSLAGNN